MTELERLTKRIESAMYWGADTPEKIAERLINEGTICPPCKEGDPVYVLDIYPDSRKCADCDHYYPGGVGDIPACEASEDWKRRRDCIEIHKEIVHRRSTLIWLIGNDFGRTVFLTREEAEAALAERGKS